MNKALLTGRVTKDPMITDKVARFTLAVDRRYKKEGEPTADFISCVGFGKTRDFIEKYVTKGTKYGIVGHIQTGSYEKDGQKIYTTDVIIDEIEFGESKKDKAPANDFVDVPDEIESELPFN